MDKLEVILLSQVESTIVQRDRRVQVSLTLSNRIHTLSDVAIGATAKVKLR